MVLSFGQDADFQSRRAETHQRARAGPTVHGDLD